MPRLIKLVILIFKCLILLLKHNIYRYIHYINNITLFYINNSKSILCIFILYINDRKE